MIKLKKESYESKMDTEIARREAVQAGARESYTKGNRVHVGHLLVFLASCLGILLLSCTSVDWDTETAIYNVYHMRLEDDSIDVEKELRNMGLRGDRLRYATEKVERIKHAGD